MGAILLAGPGTSKHASRSGSEPGSASLTRSEMKAASLPNKMKPATSDEATDEKQSLGISGVRGDSARGKNSRGGPGRPDRAVPSRRSSREHKRRVGMHNYTTCTGRESDRPIVTRKRVTTVEQRGLSVDTSR